MIQNDLLGAFQLLVVGMVTVYLILYIVIYLGKLLIVVVNKIAPEEVVKKADSQSVTVNSTTVDANTEAIIKATVAQLTDGKGAVSKITKL